MTQFRVSADGRLEDEASLRALASLKEQMPGLDALSVETYLTLSKAYWSIWTLFSASCSDFDLSVPRFNLLLVLYQTRNNPRSMTDLGVTLNVSTANVTKLIASLEQDGWAMRVPQESDRRVVYGQLTPDGEQRFKAIMPVLFKRMENLATGLSSEEKLLLNHLLTKLRLGHIADFGRQESEGTRRTRGR